ncbi:ribosome-inactivating family protein [Streptomyces fuscichromogenes]|uniref:ribosome-inactivating family protein n=1 Tax=Streptomyces fuscichromogenes TaxID=1324013 RepID=UPI0037F9729D
MRVTALRRIGVTTVVSSALAAVVLSGTPALVNHMPASAAGSTKIDAQNVDHINFPQVHWNVDGGKDAYLAMLRELRNLAESDGGARHTTEVLGTDGKQHIVVITDNTRTNSFADIVISNSGSPTVHAVVRLSDFYVVRFYTVGGTWDAQTLNLIHGVPNETGTDDNSFVGSENYNALSQKASLALNNVSLGPTDFDQALFALAKPKQTVADRAHGMLTFILGIAEAARFNQIASRVADTMDNFGSTTLSTQQVALIRSWSALSHVFVGRYNGTDPGASTSIAGATIEDIRVAAVLLAVALNDGTNPNPKDEL